MTGYFECNKCDMNFNDYERFRFHRGRCAAEIKPNINFENTPIQQEIDNNAILKEVQDLLTTQTEKGLAKYPRTVNVDDYSLSDWIDHVLQEKTDEIVYLVTIKHKIKKVIG